jgi:RNA polymerase sigma-70 factor (ECF subfamily)
MRTRKTFEQLFRTHYGHVCEEARRNGVPASDAEDVAQEAFLQYTRIRARYPESPPGRLLRSIAKNRARNFRRKHRRRNPPPPLGPATFPTPEELMRMSQGRALMARITRELPEPLRRVYVLADLEGIPLPNIADDLGLPLGTVKSRLHTARAAIDATLERFARNDELPAVLFPLLFGRDCKVWAQKIFGFMRPLTVGIAACFLVPHVPGDAPRATMEIIVAAPDQMASVDALPGEQTASAGREPTVAEKMASRADATEADHRTSRINAGSKAPRRAQSSESGRRELEMMELQDVQSAYDAGDIEGARRRLEDFDRRYPKPYLSRERDKLAARIEQAKSARSSAI